MWFFCRPLIFAFMAMLSGTFVQAETFSLASLNQLKVSERGFGSLDNIPAGFIRIDPELLRQALRPAPRRVASFRQTIHVKDLHGLISLAESHHDGYDAVQYAATILPAKPPTQMTLDEIFTWIKQTPGQNHAIGRYQFIPKTLKRLVRQARLPHTTRFNPATQDLLANLLIEEAGYPAFRSGALSRVMFMENLARIWAGLPMSNGLSYYHGYAGNRASISWAEYERHMARIFPTDIPVHVAKQDRGGLKVFPQ